MWPVDTLGDGLLTILELGQSDLLCGFDRAKFTFSNVFQWEKTSLWFNGCWQQCPFLYAKLLSLIWPYQQFVLEPFLKVKCLIWIPSLSIWKTKWYLTINPYNVIWIILIYEWLLRLVWHEVNFDIQEGHQRSKYLLSSNKSNIIISTRTIDLILL